MFLNIFKKITYLNLLNIYFTSKKWNYQYNNNSHNVII